MANERESRKYGIQVGGCALIKNGNRYGGAFGPTCVYQDMTYKHVQAFWHAMTTNPDMMMATMEYQAKMTPLLIELGNKLGIKRGDINEADLTEIKDLAE